MKHLRKFESVEQASEGRTSDYLSFDEVKKNNKNDEDWLLAEEVFPGMIASSTLQKNKIFTVIRMYSTQDFKNNPDEYLKMVALHGATSTFDKDNAIRNVKNLKKNGWWVFAQDEKGKQSLESYYDKYDSYDTVSIRVPATERWKTPKLSDLNNKTGVFESIVGVFESKQREFLNPEDVTEGMIAEWGDEEYAGVVVGIWHSDFLKANPKVYLDCLNKTKRYKTTAKSRPGGVKNVAKDLVDGWKILVKDDKNKYRFEWYADNPNDPKTPMNNIRVCTDQVWKKSKTLRDANKDFGVFENLNTEYLKPEEVLPGMTGENTYNGKLFQVLDIYSTGFLKEHPSIFAEIIKDLHTDVFKISDLEDLAIGWLVHAVDKNGMQDLMWYDDEKGMGFVVPASERWKNSNTLKDINLKNGIFESLNPAEFRVGMLGKVKPDYAPHRTINRNTIYEIIGIYDASKLSKEEWEKLIDNSYSELNYPDYYSDNKIYQLLLIRKTSDLDPLQAEFRLLKTTEFEVPDSEKWKLSDKLRDQNLKTGILENVNEFLTPDMVASGMDGQFSPYVGAVDNLARVIDIVQIKDLKNPLKFKDWQKYSNSEWLKYPFETIHAEHQPSEYIANTSEEFTNLEQFLQFNGFDTTLTYDDYLVKIRSIFDMQGSEARRADQREVVPYKTVEDNYFFRVPISEAFKKSKELKNVNKKTGLFEANVLERVSWHTGKDVLEAKDVAPGMKGYDLYSGIYVEIVQCFKIDDLTENMFKELQNKSKSKWLSFQYDFVSDPSGTRDYMEIDKENPIRNVVDFVENNSIDNTLSFDDYLMVVRTTKDINGNSDYNADHSLMTFYEVLPYNETWLEVDVKEGWKKSKTLLSTNTNTGIFEQRMDYNNWDIPAVTDKYLKPEDVVPGMIGELYENDYDDGSEVIEIHKVSNITPEIFKRMQDMTIDKMYNDDSSAWIVYYYEKDGHQWFKNREKRYKTLDEFLKNNPFRILNDDSYLAVVKTDYSFRGNVSLEHTFYDVFPYNVYDFVVPVSEAWKKSKSLQNINKKTGVIE